MHDHEFAQDIMNMKPGVMYPIHHQPEQVIGVGSVVCLNSGGPKMTVVSMAKGEALCRWFANSQYAIVCFPVAALYVPPLVMSKESCDEILKAMKKPKFDVHAHMTGKPQPKMVAEPQVIGESP